MISEATIQRVRELPVEDVISKYVSLKRSGSALTGLCPFHTEKTPSFTVTPSRNIFKCFGCGEGGDAIRFVMQHKNLAFIEAVEAIANDNGITIEYEEGKAPDPDARLKRQLLLSQLREEAEKYYTSLRSRAAGEAIRYLQSRQLSAESVRFWRIGFAREGFFHDRITIPIENTQGDIIAFGARVIASEAKQSPKYLNSPASDHYNKSQILFGLSRARSAIRKSGFAILVEGYTDVIRLHQYGWPEAVATCGTALTPEHSTLLRKYTDGIIIMRDGDNAGLKAIVKDIEILSHDFSNIKIIMLPAGDDPDSLFAFIERGGWSDCLSNILDAYEWQCSQWLEDAYGDTAATALAISKCAELLARLPDQVQRDFYVGALSKLFHIKEKQFKTALTDKLQQDSGELFPEDEIPKWVNLAGFYRDGFVMNNNCEKDRVGIYFKGESRPIIRLTNYIIKPLYLIIDALNSRRLIEVHNGFKTSVVELPNRAFTSQDVFETEVISKGAFYSEPGFSKPHYKRLVNWLTENMAMVHELKTLGWQPEGFFAFSNKIIVPSRISQNGKLNGVIEYDEYGIAKIEDRSYLSPGVSKLNVDLRAEDNIYENDMYLKYKESPITFAEWAKLFCQVYGGVGANAGASVPLVPEAKALLPSPPGEGLGVRSLTPDDHGTFGIAFIFLSAFKDIVTRVTKQVMPYFYGPKGSGKSAMGESMMWFFFSGKNAEGKLIQAFNLNPGQGSPFAFFGRLERFRNVFMLFNEYDPSSVEFWKKGAFKSAYDSEGREKGSETKGAGKRKTEIQKVQCVPGIAGQYLDTTDDGSVFSRSIPLQFSGEKSKSRTAEQTKLWEKLNAYEYQGISSLAASLYEFRDKVAEQFKKEFWIQQDLLKSDMRKSKHLSEERLLNNYGSVLAMIKIMEKLVTLPFTYEEFYQQCRQRCIAQTRILKDNNMLATFWSTVEVLFDEGLVQEGIYFSIRKETEVELQQEGKRFKKPVQSITGSQDAQILYIRLNIIHDKYAKRFREKSNKVAPDEDTVRIYMQDQPYYIGLCPQKKFRDKNTSAIALNYDMMELAGINLTKTSEEMPVPLVEKRRPEPSQSSMSWQNEGKEENLPF